MFRHLGDLLTIKILNRRIKNLYCQNRDILGFSENYLKLLHALYNCVANIRCFSIPTTLQAVLISGHGCALELNHNLHLVHVLFYIENIVMIISAYISYLWLGSVFMSPTKSEAKGGHVVGGTPKGWQNVRKWKNTYLLWINTIFTSFKHQFPYPSVHHHFGSFEIIWHDFINLFGEPLLLSFSWGKAQEHTAMAAKTAVDRVTEATVTGGTSSHGCVWYGVFTWKGCSQHRGLNLLNFQTSFGWCHCVQNGSIAAAAMFFHQGPTWLRS